MQISLTAGEPAVLLEPDDFTAFSVVSPTLDPERVADLVHAADIGVPTPDGKHVQVDIDTVRGLAGDHRTAAWNEKFDAMIAYARSKGWVDDSGTRVRAHIEKG